MHSSRNQFLQLIEQEKIPTEKIDHALTLVEIHPNSRCWRAFVDSLLLWTGCLALVFSLLFLIAYNWEKIGQFAKFGLVQTCIVLAILAYCKLDENSIASKLALLMASITLGVLLALYGQTYQTGADSWQLFFSWALLILPWTIIGRLPVLWVLWIGLINLSFTLYFLTFQKIFGFLFSTDDTLLWIIFLFNTLALTSWQLLTRIYPWLSERWAVRLLATVSGSTLTWIALLSVFKLDEGNSLVWPVWGLWLLTMYIVYRHKKVDLFMLAGCCLSVIVITTSSIARSLLEIAGVVVFLILAFIVICLGASAAYWLKKIQQENHI